MSAISDAIAKATGSSSNKLKQQKDNLEKQVEAAEFYGCIKSDNVQEGPKKRGRPPNKSKSPGPTPRTSPSRASEPKLNGLNKPTDESVKKALDEMKKASLIAKIRACARWWPDICGPTLATLNIYLCSVEQLETICKGFEDTVMLESEIVDIPRGFKEALGQFEKAALAVSAAKPDHYIFSQGRKLRGLNKKLEEDPAVDRNVKLLSLRFLGKMPRNPYIGLLTSVFLVAAQVFKDNTIEEMINGSGVVEEEFNDL